MIRVLAGIDLVLSDAHLQDSFWLARLFEETPELQAFALSDEASARRRHFPDAAEEEAQPRPHRAEADARHLATVWETLLNRDEGG